MSATFLLHIQGVFYRKEAWACELAGIPDMFQQMSELED